MAAKFSTRYGLLGLTALALLSLVHSVRENATQHFKAGAYLIGVLPNVAAAVAITFVLLSIWADQNRDATFQAAVRPFIVCAAISGLGLIGWEFVQTTSNRFGFDPHDVGATLVGIAIAGLLFLVLTPRTIENL